jgi:hypothetical protein
MAVEMHQLESAFAETGSAGLAPVLAKMYYARTERPWSSLWLGLRSLKVQGSPAGSAEDFRVENVVLEVDFVIAQVAEVAVTVMAMVSSFLPQSVI